MPTILIKSFKCRKGLFIAHCVWLRDLWFSAESWRSWLWNIAKHGFVCFLITAFVRTEENLNNAVLRGLSERTGLTNIYLEQFTRLAMLAALGLKWCARCWKLMVVDADGAYRWMLDGSLRWPTMPLINYKDSDAQARCPFGFVSGIPSKNWKLIFDPKHIVDETIQTLRDNLNHQTGGGNLLRKNSPWTNMQNIYIWSILGTKLYRTTFQRRCWPLEVSKRYEKHFLAKRTRRLICIVLNSYFFSRN